MNSKSLALGLVLGLAVGLPVVFLTLKLFLPSSSESTPQPTYPQPTIPQPQPTQPEIYSDYTRVEVVSGGQVNIGFGTKAKSINYFFYYKSMGHYDGNGEWISGYNPETPIAVDCDGFADRNLTSTVGQTYDIFGIEVIVFEVQDDYVILYVKRL